MRVEAPPFEPPLGLRNPHLQSILASQPPRRGFVMRRARALLAESRDVQVDCGDGVRLLGHHTARPGGRGELVLMVHGWEGSAESIYVLSCAAHLYALGYDVFRLNLRDHGPTHHLNPELFHSCRIAEVVGAVRTVQELAGARPLSLVGYSLGGNFALRVAVRAPAAGIRLRRVVAVCPVLDPVHTLDRLEHGAWIYRSYFVRKWRRSLLKKRQAWPDLYDLDELLEPRGLAAMTEQLVLRFAGYPDLLSYLRGYAIVGPALATLAVPSRILSALDDPIIPASDLDRLADPPALGITTTAHGGHCGFLDNLRRESWADRQIAAILSAT
jgi:predicted alpha/beta-fold hydrolase